MIQRTITAGQVGRVLLATDAAILRGQKRAMLEAAAIGAEVLAKAAPVDTGRLKQSFRLRKKGASGHPEIVADAPHAGTVEAGARPHWVPLRPLVGWVRRHASVFGIGAGAPGARGRNARSGRFTADPNIVRIARAIQRKIAREGTRPTWFVRRSLPKLRMILVTLLSEAKAKVLSDIARRSEG